ncbi:MAG: hypothetical protein OXU20_19145 [Myxococcales bacterium]|nr:hypothetical protein [Myxococcales bacterium]MDD9965360.1 hypothetical protein [Myxococcales bacterium]
MRCSFVTATLLAAQLVGVLGLRCAQAQGYLRRPLVLPKGTVRIDVGPSDYGYMDHGFLNEDRGFRVQDAGDDVALSLGGGLAYGLGRGFELGGLVMPLQFSPGTDVGDLEAYGRYGLSSAISLQATLQIPTQTEVGLGLGMPVVLQLGGGGRIETGVELEFIFVDDTIANLDAPIAFQFAVGGNLFLGLRTGVLLVDFDEAVINLGVQGGATVTPEFDLTVAFNFPYFLQTGPGDTVQLDGWEFTVGANIFL